MLYTTSLILTLGRVDNEEDIAKWRERYMLKLSGNLFTDNISFRVLSRNKIFIIFRFKMLVIIFITMEIIFIKLNAVHESALCDSRI